MTIEEIQKLIPQNSTPAAKELGHRIRQARRTRNVTARELATALKIQPGSIYHWERGVYAPGAFNLQKAAILLGMPVEYFLGLELTAKDPAQAATVKESLAQIGSLFGEQDADLGRWSPSALTFLSSVLQFGLAPSPTALSALIKDHPLVSADSESSPPMLRWSKRTGLVEWLLGATDAGLDIVEDVVRHLSSK